MRKPLIYTAAMLFVAGAILAPGLAAAADEAKPEKAPVYPSKASSMKIAGQLQFRFTNVDKDASTKYETDTFNWKRARLTFEGDVNEFLYFQMKFQGDDLPVDAAKGQGKWGFNTTYLGFHLPGTLGDIEAGRFDVESTPRCSSSKAAFAERAQHTENNKAGGQLGVRYGNSFLDDRIVISVGAYNGNGDLNSDIGNDNSSLMTAGRITLTPFAKYDFDSESDLKNSDFGVGLLVGAWKDHRGSQNNTKAKIGVTSVVSPTPTAFNNIKIKNTVTTTSADPNRADVTCYGAALSMKYKGLFALLDFTNRDSNGISEDSAGVVIPKYDFKAKGYSAQISYAIPIGKRMFLEPAARIEQYKDDYKSSIAGGLEADSNFEWTTLGLNWFISNFNASIQADYIMKKEKGALAKIDNDTLMIQANLYF